MARIGQGPVGGDLPGGVGATDRSGRHGTSVAAALPRAWMVDKVLAAVLARDARHRRRKVTYFRSPEHQETDSASSRNMLNLLVGPIPSQELQQKRRKSGLLEPCLLTKHGSASLFGTAAVASAPECSRAETSVRWLRDRSTSAMADLQKPPQPLPHRVRATRPSIMEDP